VGVVKVTREAREANAVKVTREAREANAVKVTREARVDLKSGASLVRNSIT
jgi:hypothetical protein